MHWNLKREQARRPQDLKPQAGQVQNLCAPRGSVTPIIYLVVWGSLAGIVLHTLSTANPYCRWYIFTTYGWTIPSYPYISRIFYVKAIGGRKWEFLLMYLSTGLQLILWIGAKIHGVTYPSMSISQTHFDWLWFMLPFAAGSGTVVPT